MELHQNDLLTPHIIPISAISVSVDKDLFLLHMCESTVRTQSILYINQENEGSRSPRYSKIVKSAKHR